jgi:hypothetical protein
MAKWLAFHNENLIENQISKTGFGGFSFSRE